MTWSGTWSEPGHTKPAGCGRLPAGCPDPRERSRYHTLEAELSNAPSSQKGDRCPPEQKLRSKMQFSFSLALLHLTAPARTEQSVMGALEIQRALCATANPLFKKKKVPAGRDFTKLCY